MRRRRDVVAATALVLLSLVVAAGGALVALTQSARGQQWLARVALAQLSRGFQGRIELGRVSGTLLTGIAVDTVTVRDWQDSVIFTSGRIAATWDPRDLLDRRIAIRSLEAVHPQLHIRQYENGDWNYKHVFGPWGRKAPPRLPGQRRFGDYVVIDTATVRDGGFTLTLPWHPADSLRGARRDSAVAHALGRLDAEIVRAGGPPERPWFRRSWRWTRIALALGRTRLAHPDSAGQRFTLRTADAVETDPPFAWRNVRGTVAKLGDSVWVDLPHWDLSGSTGRGAGKIWWGSNLPTRYDVTVEGDSVSLRDVAWIYPTLPRRGSGRTTLHIVSRLDEPRVIEYRLRGMDARAERSRLIGDMTFAVGGPVLGVTDVDLRLAPMHTDLARTFNGEPFPFDWQGELRGRVVARGGPANRFVVDRAELTYDDAHVPGARSRVTGRGMADINFPAFTVFRGFEVLDAEVDLRTPRFVNPDFPELNGVVRGRAILDSLWYDVRFRAAELLHVDGPGPPSRATGSGRVTLEEEFVRFDVDLEAAPLSYTTLARSYPLLPLRGLAAGPIRASGTANDATVALVLRGEGGVLRYEGQVDVFEPTFAARGSWRADSVSLPALLGDTTWPASRLAAGGTLAVAGATAADLAGTAELAIADGSRLADVRVFEGRMQLHLYDGRVVVDTLQLTTSAGALSARGGLGLVAGARDSLRLRAQADSLGGLRALLGTAASGQLSAQLTLAGTVDTSAASQGLDLRAVVEGRGVAALGVAAARARAELDFTDALRTIRGKATLVVDSADVALRGRREAGEAPVRRPRVAAARLTLAVDSGGRTAWNGWGRGGNGASLALSGRGVIDGTAEGASARLVLDTVTLEPDSAAMPYRLAAPAVVRVADGRRWQLDSLALRRADGRGLSLQAAGPWPLDAAHLSGALAFDGVPLSDLGRTAQLPLPLGGTLNGRILAPDVGGLGLAGGFTGALRLDTARVGPLRLDSLRTTLDYARRRLAVGATLSAGGTTVAEATLGASFGIGSDPTRAEHPDRPLEGRLSSPAADLAILRGLVPALEAPQGALGLDVRLSGTPAEPRLDGAFTVRGGRFGVLPLGVQLADVEADVRLTGDTLEVRRLFARGTPRDGAGAGDRRLGAVLGLTGAPRDPLADSLGVRGWVAVGDVATPRFDLVLAANQFTAIDRARTASLELSTPRPVRLAGSLDQATLRGTVRLDRGRIAVPALSQKRVVDLADNLDLVDTARVDDRVRLPRAPDRLVRGLTLDGLALEVGDDLWLRSPEANIKLGGALRVTRGFDERTGDPLLALSDSLIVERGTYQLNLGLARPTFDVERGVIRFFGEPEINPALNINALHVVRAQRANSNRQDVRIRVTVGGTLQQPALSLSSADTPPLPESDMLSYLITGEPAFARLGTQYAEQGATLALRLAGSYLSSRLAGGPFDVVQVQPSLFGQTEALGAAPVLGQNRLGNVLAGTRIGVGGQVGANTFLTLSTGLCGLDPAAAGGSDQLSLFAQGIGVKVERRLDRTTSLEFGLEPGSSALACGRLGTSRTFQQTPPQIGIDLFKTWLF